MARREIDEIAGFIAQDSHQAAARGGTTAQTAEALVRLGTSSFVAAALAALFGCAGESGSSFELVDSAGVAIGVNAAGSVATAKTWTLSPEPVTEIGGGVNRALQELHPCDGRDSPRQRERSDRQRGSK